MEKIKNIIQASIDVKTQILADEKLMQTVMDCVNVMVSAFEKGNKVLFCGNGGSASDAQHLAAEFSGRFYTDRDALPAEALHCNTSYMTAVANDYSYDVIYSRLIKGKDRAEEIIKNVIRNKENIVAAAGAYSCKIYIKAVQEDSSAKKNKPAKEKDTADKANADLKRMAMAEVALTYDYESPQHTKEERTGVTKGRKADGLFYLSTTRGDS